MLYIDWAAGELLLIPMGWWRRVRGLDISVTVTFVNFVFAHVLGAFPLVARVGIAPYLHLLLVPTRTQIRSSPRQLP